MQVTAQVGWPGKKKETAPDVPREEVWQPGLKAKQSTRDKSVPTGGADELAVLEGLRRC